MFYDKLLLRKSKPGQEIFMNVATSLNRNYIRYTYVMLSSLFQNNTFEPITVYLLHSELTEDDLKLFQSLADRFGNTICSLRLSRNDFPDELPVTDSWTLEAYYRLTLLDVLPMDMDRLLYLDVDMIINKSLQELYTMDFEGAEFIVCKDMTVSLPFSDLRQELFQYQIAQGFTYFNSGMMLWNLPLLRSSYSFSSYMELASTLHYMLFAPDQDLLNFIHWDRVKFVDEQVYNLFSKVAYLNGFTYEQVKKQTAIVHYAGYKPWQGCFVHYDTEHLWWEYAKDTPFYHEMLESFVFTCLNDASIFRSLLEADKEQNRLRTELTKSVELCKQLYQLIPQ